MRQIEFRCFDTETKKFLEYFWIDHNGKPCKDNMYSAPCELDSDKLILDQFTGLFDANGNKIFEGDIIQRDNHLFDINVIIFYRGMFGWFEFDDEENTEDFTVISGWEPETRLKIIGNVHQRPEFLNKHPELLGEKYANS